MSFDELAKQAGLVIENLDRVKTLNMALLEKGQIGLYDPGKWMQPHLRETAGIEILQRPEEAGEAGLSGWIYVDDVIGSFEPPPCLILRPKSLVVGVWLIVGVIMYCKTWALSLIANNLLNSYK